jgi:hypothetical protein
LVHGLPFAARLFAHAILSRVGLLADVGEPPAIRDVAQPAHAMDRVVFGYGSLERLRAELLHDLMTPESELELEVAAGSGRDDPDVGADYRR